MRISELLDRNGDATKGNCTDPKLDFRPTRFGDALASALNKDLGVLGNHPAVQNMLLAPRALGLGATLTTLYLEFETETEAALGLPPGVHSYALLPIGYRWAGSGQSAVSPLADVVYEDRWG